MSLEVIKFGSMLWIQTTLLQVVRRENIKGIIDISGVLLTQGGIETRNDQDVNRQFTTHMNKKLTMNLKFQ
jgi:hypothetical protein